MIKRFLQQREAAAFEKQLPFTLRLASALLQAGIPFEKVLTNLSKLEGACGEKFKQAVNSLRRGATMQQSLEPLAIEGSSYGERARGELLFAYRQGRGAENLRRLADEVSLNNKSRAKNAQSKQSILSLALVTTACIVPALFAAYASVGSSLLQSSVDGTTAFIVLAILFPLANAGLLALVRFLGD